MNTSLVTWSKHSVGPRNANFLTYQKWRLNAEPHLALQCANHRAIDSNNCTYNNNNKGFAADNTLVCDG